MSDRFHEAIEEVRSRCDILEVAGAHLSLARSGASFKGLCPFHKEKTPSFHVNPARQTFHCFGCGKGGDVFRFVMEMENADFPTALRILARRAGVAIPEGRGERRGDRPRKDRLYELHDEVAALYRRRLLESPEAAAARDYLRDRSLDGPASEHFGLGYAPAGPDFLVREAARRGWPAQAMVEAGLLHPGDAPSGRGRGPADRFQNRLMFPVWDETGRVVGFSGRVLRPEDHPAKYVNSPETPVFRKGRLLYAMHRARRAMAGEGCALLCEGQIDVIRCHTAGLAHAVAAQGTAVTAEHARILRRATAEVVLLLDGDEAGEAAARRTAGVLLEAGLHVRAVALPPGEDPDSFLLSRGPEALRALIREAPEAALFVLEGFERRGELGGAAGVARAARAAIELAARVPEAVPRELLLRKAAARLQVPEEAMRQDLLGFLGRGARVAAEDAAPPPEAAARGGDPGPEPLFELALIEHLLQHRSAPGALDCAKAYVPERIFRHPVTRELFGRVVRQAADPAWNPVLERPEDGPFTRCAARVVMAEEKPMGSDLGPEDALRGLILTLWRKELERRRDALRRAGGGGEGARVAAEERLELSVHLAALRRGWEAALPVIELHLEE